MLHIGFDAKRVFQNYTGLGNYSRGVIGGLQAAFPQVQYTLFAPKIVQNPTTAAFAAPPYRTVSPLGNAAYWRTVGMLRDIRQQKIDIYHGLSHELPLGIGRTQAASVVTVHDLIFKHYPAQYGAWDRRVHDAKCRYACRVADRILAISESTKQDIMQSYGVAEGRITVVYQSCHARFYTPAPDTDILAKANIAAPYILYVGSLIARKNLLGLVQAMALLPPAYSAVRLYVVGGGQGAYSEQVRAYISANGLQTRIVFLSDVADTDLPTLYRRAAAFVYPSHYEGFGIPIIEALFSQTPVITGTQMALREAAGEQSLCVDVREPAHIAEAMAQVLSDTALAKTMRQAGLAHAERFLPQGLAQQLMGLYERLL